MSRPTSYAIGTRHPAMCADGKVRSATIVNRPDTGRKLITPTEREVICMRTGQRHCCPVLLSCARALR